MFTKAFRVKSNTVLKGSAKRKLKSDVAVAFPSLSAEELSELLPNKEELNVVKVYAHKGESVTLYVLHKNPLLFELDKRLYPTVYMLWRFPNVLPAFTTWPAVLQKMVGGADLMLPGVVIPSSGLPDVRQGDCCGVKVVSNRAPMAVGTSTMSSTEMLNMGMKGKGVSVIHTYMDHLWAFGDKSDPPSIPDTGCEGLVGNGEGSDDEEEEEGEEEEGGVEQQQRRRPAEQLTPDQPSCPAMEDMSLKDRLGEESGLPREEPSLKAAGDKDTGDEEDFNDEDQKVPQEELDALLLQCFLHALKTKVKKSELPLLTSTFLRKYMFSCCPNGKQLDIKRSSYKKLSRFLQSMQQQHHLVHVKELSKGVESIVEVDWRNPQLLSFRAPEQAEEEPPVEGGDGGEKPYQPPEVTSLYSVSARLEPLFLEAHKRKGSVLHASDVRLIITEYVKNNQLVCELNKNYVTINPALCDGLLERTEYQEISALKWDDLFSRTLSRMQPCYQLVFPGQAPITKKGQIEPIDISVASRGSNKKVTLIKNLELYGLDPVAVSSALRHRVQASSVLQPLPGAKDRVQVQIQGSQIQQVGNLLLDQYKIPRKFIQGLDKAPKGGKKK